MGSWCLSSVIYNSSCVFGYKGMKGILLLVSVFLSSTWYLSWKCFVYLYMQCVHLFIYVKINEEKALFLCAGLNCFCGSYVSFCLPSDNLSILFSWTWKKGGDDILDIWGLFFRMRKFKYLGLNSQDFFVDPIFVASVLFCGSHSLFYLFLVALMSFCVCLVWWIC